MDTRTPVTTEQRPTCTVLAPLLYLSTTIELEGDEACVHYHPAGQGFWIARMLATLGCDARIVAPVGGEAGEAVAALLPGWGVELNAVRGSFQSPSVLQDRRTGERQELVPLRVPQLDRHIADDLYALTLEAALTCDALVLTSAGNSLLHDDAYARLMHDVQHSPTALVADLHGSALDAVLDTGSLTVLKVSEEDLAEDGYAMGTEQQAVDVAHQLGARGARTVVISRAAQPAIAWFGGRVARVIPPDLEVVDHHGAGDSMTAGMTVGHLLGLSGLDLVRLGAAAGAGNVIRHGLGSGRAELILQLSDLVETEEL